MYFAYSNSHHARHTFVTETRQKFWHVIIYCFHKTSRQKFGYVLRKDFHMLRIIIALLIGFTGIQQKFEYIIVFSRKKFRSGKKFFVVLVYAGLFHILNVVIVLLRIFLQGLYEKFECIVISYFLKISCLKKFWIFI